MNSHSLVIDGGRIDRLQLDGVSLRIKPFRQTLNTGKSAVQLALPTTGRQNMALDHVLTKPL